MLTESKLLEG